MRVVNMCSSSVLIKSEKNNEETNQTYWIRKTEILTTTVREYATRLAADNTPPHWPPLRGSHRFLQSTAHSFGKVRPIM